MAEQKRPNILYIMADQMAAPMLSMYDSSSPVKTPNLDQLAREGVVFESAYCNSPLCAPSRFTMVTGQLPSKIGGYDNASNLSADIPTYAHYLRRQGYHTALAGKMHFCGPDQLHGFEQRLTSDIYPGDYGWTVNWDEPEIRPDWYHDMASVLDAGPVVRTNQLDFDDEVIYKSTQYLYDHVRYRNEQPFCLTVSMTHPHDPYAMTKDFWDLYEGVDIPLPKTAAIPHDQQDPHSQRVLKCIDLYGRDMPEEKIRAARRAYFAACTYVDTQVGKLIHTLESCNLAENTIVVFTGDHGDMLGERGLWYKMVWYEMAARVPLVIHAPKLYSPKRVKENVSTMDLLPTFVGMAGSIVHPSLPLDGMSLMPYISGEEGVKMDTVIGEYMGEGTLSPVVMIRRGRWKFVYSPLDPPQLYDVVSDPTESVNLATTTHLGTLTPPSNHEKALDRLSHTSTITSPFQSEHDETYATHNYSSSANTFSSSPPPSFPFHSSISISFQPPTPPRTPYANQSQSGPPRPNPPHSDGPQPNLPHPDHPPTPSTLPSSSSSSSSSRTSNIHSLLASFQAEVSARWDMPALQAAVLTSQRQRRLVYDALSRGVRTAWEYAPPVNASAVYMRNGKTARGEGLGDMEGRSRWPRVERV